MSNKPKIYAHCAAGCKWETIHKSDMAEFVTLIQEPINEDGTFYAELGKEYKIYAPIAANGNFDCKIVFACYFEEGTENERYVEYEIPFINEDEYADSFIFRLLDMTAVNEGTEHEAAMIVFELAGTRYVDFISGTAPSFLDERYLCITGATKVYLHNNGVELETMPIATLDEAKEALREDLIAQTTGDSEEVTMSQKAITEGLEGRVATGDIVQETGDSETAVMSQKAVTSNISMIKSLLDVDGADANNIAENGYYFFGSDDNVSNVPAGVGGGVIISVIQPNAGGYRNYQICCSYDYGWYARNQKGTVWSDWIKVAYVSDIPDIPENMLTLRSELTDEDLNSVETSGYYFAGSGVTVTNCPEGETGKPFMLLVIDGVEISRRYQLYFSYETQRMYWRRRTANFSAVVWGEWQKIATMTDIPTIPENMLVHRGELTTADLNEVVTSGYYFAGNDATVTNYPEGETGTGFMLLVINGEELSRRYQLYFSYNTQRMYWRRQTFGSTVVWGDWSKIAYVSDIPNISEGSLTIQKDSTGSFNISFGKYTCKFRRFVNEDRNADLYDLYDIYCGDTLITNGNIMGVLKEDGQSDFMGGIDHGDEKDYTLSIKCDNSDYDIESGALVSCDNIEINYTSKLYRVSDGTHIYNKTVRLNITKDKIVVYNNCKCLVDDSVLVHAYNGGMVDCQFPTLVGTVMDNLYSFPAPTAEPNNNSHENVNSVLYWTGGAVRLNNITGHQKDTYKGRVVAYKNSDGTPQRNKIYYDLVGATATPIANGEQIVGEYEMIFE